MTCKRHGLLLATAALLACALGCAHPSATDHDGVKPEHSPQPTSRFVTREPGNRKVIIFIHGVFGDVEGTWRNQNGAFFPDLLASDPKLKGYDTYLVGYPSPLLWHSLTLEEVSSKTLQRLSDDGLLSNYDELYFVGHSMGGLVTERVLASLNSFDNVKVLRRVHAAIFLSTPASGAPVADFASYISANPQLSDMKPATLNSWLQGVQNDITRMRIGRDSAAAWFPRMYAAYETQKTHGVLVVSRVYANLPTDALLTAMDVDHPGIAKPESRNDDSYIWVRARILQAGDRRPEPLPPRPVAMVDSVTIDFRTDDDDKDDEMGVFVNVSSAGRMLATGDGGGKGSGHGDVWRNNSNSPSFRLALTSGAFPLTACSGGRVRVWQSSSRGTDPGWKMSFLLSFWADGRRYVVRDYGGKNEFYLGNKSHPDDLDAALTCPGGPIAPH